MGHRGSIGPWGRLNLNMSSPALRRRRRRISSPVALGTRRDDSAALKFDRYRRQSVNSIYLPGQILAHADEDAFIPVADDPEYEFPTWWFFVLPSQYYLEWMLGGCLWGIVWPKTISNIFGPTDKAIVLGGLGTLGTLIGFLGPIVGNLSDRLAEYAPEFAARWGRRRPFIALGQGLNVICLVLCYHGVYTGTVWLLVVALQVSNMTNQLGGPAFSAIVPETIPESQRGLCVTIQSW
jgi:hypothetical protein